VVTNHKVTGKAMSLPVGILVGIGISTIITLLGCCLLAYLICAERMNGDAIGYGTMIILLASAGTGAWSATALVKRRKELVAALIAIGYYLVLLLITALFFGGVFRGMVTTAIVILAGSATALLYGMKGNGLSYKGNYRKRIR